MAPLSEDIEYLEKNLDSFDPQTRRCCLQSLVDLAQRGLIQLPPERETANLHCHTFFSYNGYGYSPTHIAWLGRKLGARFMGIVDFDVLDGVDEFLDACEVAGVRGSTGMETRIVFPEYADKETNSPGEPGITYHIGIGFTSSIAPETAAEGLEEIRQRAEGRNREMLECIKRYLAPLKIDYDTDILPITPNRNATERHIVERIVEKSINTLEDPVRFWSEKLGLSEEEVHICILDLQSFYNTVRSKLMKRGGIGYVQPTVDSFPLIDEFHRIVLACGALPCVGWLDGTSDGEREIKKLLGLLVEKGAAAVNIVPDRNWNIADPQVKAEKLANLYRVVEAARALDLPIIVGTEMNSFGQKHIDDFDTPELVPIRDDFIEGAYFIYGHTRMQRLWGMGAQSEWACTKLPERKSRNAFYITAGKAIPPGKLTKEILAILSSDMSVETVFNQLDKMKEHCGHEV